MNCHSSGLPRRHFCHALLRECFISKNGKLSSASEVILQSKYGFLFGSSPFWGYSWGDTEIPVMLGASLGALRRFLGVSQLKKHQKPCWNAEYPLDSAISPALCAFHVYPCSATAMIGVDVVLTCQVSYLAFWWRTWRLTENFPSDLVLFTTECYMLHTVGLHPMRMLMSAVLLRSNLWLRLMEIDIYNMSWKMATTMLLSSTEISFAHFHTLAPRFNYYILLEFAT